VLFSYFFKKLCYYLPKRICSQIAEFVTVQCYSHILNFFYVIIFRNRIYTIGFYRFLIVFELPATLAESNRNGMERVTLPLTTSPVGVSLRFWLRLKKSHRSVYSGLSPNLVFLLINEKIKYNKQHASKKKIIDPQFTKYNEINDLSNRYLTNKYKLLSTVLASNGSPHRATHIGEYWISLPLAFLISHWKLVLVLELKCNLISVVNLSHQGHARVIFFRFTRLYNWRLFNISSWLN
jgi:hypothetical protein